MFLARTSGMLVRPTAPACTHLRGNAKSSVRMGEKPIIIVHLFRKSVGVPHKNTANNITKQYKGQIAVVEEQVQNQDLYEGKSKTRVFAVSVALQHLF